MLAGRSRDGALVGHVTHFAHYLEFTLDVPLPLPLSTGLLPMIYVAAAVVLKQKGICCN